MIFMPNQAVDESAAIERAHALYVKHEILKPVAIGRVHSTAEIVTAVKTLDLRAGALKKHLHVAHFVSAAASALRWAVGDLSQPGVLLFDHALTNGRKQIADPSFQQLIDRLEVS